MKTPQVIAALGALAHEHRLAIYRRLVERGPQGLPAGAIAERVGLVPSSLTFHLQALHRAGLIVQRREGRQLIYSADYDAMDSLVGYLTENCCADRRPGVCDRVLSHFQHRQRTRQVSEDRMKRFHLHVSVDNLEESIRFYSTVFAAQPVVRQQDYAKWMLDDPRINFAISSHRQPVGINHVGFQVDTDEELRSMHAQLEAADARLIQEDEQPCCYARSDKYWVTDPSGIAWETFHTLGSIPVYGEDTPVFSHGISSVPGPSVAATAKSACCVPAQSETA